MCLGLYSRCRFILTNLYLKVLHFDILIQLNSTAHFLENVLGLIKGVCRINIPCLLIGTREYIHLSMHARLGGTFCFFTSLCCVKCYSSSAALQLSMYGFAFVETMLVLRNNCGPTNYQPNLTQTYLKKVNFEHVSSLYWKCASCIY